MSNSSSNSNNPFRGNYAPNATGSTLPSAFDQSFSNLSISELENGKHQSSSTSNPPFPVNPAAFAAPHQSGERSISEPPPSYLSVAGGNDTPAMGSHSGQVQFPQAYMPPGPSAQTYLGAGSYQPQLPPRPYVSESSRSIPLPEHPSRARSVSPPQTSSSLQARNEVRNSFYGRDPLNPPPFAFSRPRAQVQYGPFPMMTLYAKKQFLDGGFPLVPPTVSVPESVHPFAVRDVPEADWIRFLQDVQITAKLSGTERVIAGVLPMTMPLGATGFFVSKAIERVMKKRKSEPVGDLINLWNSNFFNPRGMAVILARGQEISSGPLQGQRSPDMPPQFPGHQVRRSSFSSISSSSSAHTSHNILGQDRSERKLQRERRKRERRFKRDSRKQEKGSQGKRENKMNRETEKGFRLLIVPC